MKTDKILDRLNKDLMALVEITNRTKAGQVTHKIAEIKESIKQELDNYKKSILEEVLELLPKERDIEHPIMKDFIRKANDEEAGILKSGVMGWNDCLKDVKKAIDKYLKE